MMFPLLRYLSSHSNSAHSIPFLPHESSSHDLYTHLLTLPSLRTASQTPFSLTTSSLQTLLEMTDVNALGNKDKRTESTNSELLYFHLESLLSSLLYRTTSVLSFCSSTCEQYIEKEKELQETASEAETETKSVAVIINSSSDSLLHGGYSFGYVTCLSKIAQTVFALFPLCWHLCSVLAHTSQYLSGDEKIKRFYSEFESNLWIFKDLESSLQLLVESELSHQLTTGSTERKLSEEDLDNQLRNFQTQIGRVEDVVRRLCSGTFTDLASQDVWTKIISGEVLVTEVRVLVLLS
jgi:hypothetical protein